MSASVPFFPPLPSTEEVVSTKVVSAKTWSDTASLTNWLLGRGAQLVACHDPQITIEEGDDKTFHYYAQPRYQAIDLIWTVTARSTSSNRSALFEIKAPSGGTAQTFSAGRTRIDSAMVMYRQNRSAQSNTPGDFTINIKAVDRGLKIESIGCFEAPRLNLAVDPDDLGIDVETLARREPIYRIDESGRSLGSLTDSVTACRSICRRSSMFSFAWPAEVPGAWFTHNESDTDVFNDSLVVIPRHILLNPTATQLTLAAYARTNSSTTEGVITFTRSDAASTDLTIAPGGGFGSFAWYTTDFSFLNEDATDDAGRPGGDWETCAITAKITDGPVGTNSLYIASVCIIEQE